jgi:4-amino-4-deoxy-L-arabinose transferase-like glycosyltransferase
MMTRTQLSASIGDVAASRGDVMSDRTCRAILLLVIAAGAVLRFRGLRFGFPNPLARPDEEVLVDAALGVLRDPNPRFFDWPSLFIYVTAAAYAALFAVERVLGGAIRHATVAKAAFEPVLHLIPRVLSATAGILTVAALFGAARELFSRQVAVVAAAFLAVAFLHVRDSHFGVTDVPATFLTVCAFWASLRCATRGVTDLRAALAGILCGLAASTKYNVALVLLPAIAGIFLPVASNPPRSIASPARALALLLLCAACGFLIGTPYAVLDHQNFLAAVTAVRRHLAAGHVVMARGWPYHATFTFRYGLGIPLMIAASAGACWLIVERPRLAALVLAFPVPYYVVLGFGHTVFVRYLVPMVPFVCLTAAFLVDRAAELVGGRSNAPAVRDMTIVVLASIIGAQTLTASLQFDRLMTIDDTRVLGADWIVSHFPSGASMYQSGFGAGHVQPKPRGLYPQYRFNERADRFELDDRSAAKDLPDLIVLLESPLGPYSEIPPRIRSLVAAEYELATAFESVPQSLASAAIYDREDAFFAPFGGIENAVHPGPNVEIFRRRRPD